MQLDWPLGALFHNGQNANKHFFRAPPHGFFTFFDVRGGINLFPQNEGMAVVVCSVRNITLMWGAEYYCCNGPQRWIHNLAYTERFVMVPESLENPRSQLSNDPGIIKNGSAYTELWAHLCGPLQQ